VDTGEHRRAEFAMNAVSPHRQLFPGKVRSFIALLNAFYN